MIKAQKVAVQTLYFSIYKVSKKLMIVDLFLKINYFIINLKSGLINSDSNVYF